MYHSCTLWLGNISHHYQYIRADYCHKTEQTENLLLHFPSFAVFQPFQKEILEWVRGFLVGQAVVNVLIICVSFEPQFISVGEEDQAEKEEYEYKSEWGFFDG